MPQTSWRFIPEAFPRYTDHPGHCAPAPPMAAFSTPQRSAHSGIETVKV
jgi:hypothetical protein